MRLTSLANAFAAPCHRRRRRRDGLFASSASRAFDFGTSTKESTVTTRETRSPYDALSIESNASANEIKRAFRALAKTKHPDVTADDGAAFRLVVSAYDVLSDDVLRLDLANGEIVRHGEFTWRLGDGDVAKTRATKWTYDDSETFVRWTKPRRARAPRVEGLTLAPSDRDERVRKWRLSQFVSLWCVVERTRDGFDLESSASARSSPERRFGSVRFVSVRFVSFRFVSFRIYALFARSWSSHRTKWCRAWRVVLTTVVPAAFAVVVLSRAYAPALDVASTLVAK